MSRTLFLNLTTKDVSRASDFYTALGFELVPDFTNEQAACVKINDQLFAMLVSESFFSTIVTDHIAWTGTGAAYALSAESREEVDELVQKALATGGQKAKDPQDEGFMYGWSFLDPDGHHWEVMWMDPNAGAA
ncbi:VOC family protein [Jiangella gansuensis]|uniref:VOC family protein n=1 Tax=Jiangella gansuensis TaxID=281473 RepID=UPI00047C1C12|nr:VOC family protein [Jiangella gansuensis]